MEYLRPIGDKIRNFLAELEESTRLPSKEELIANFPHQAGCSGNSQLVESKKYFPDPTGGAWVSFGTYGNVLQCSECGVAREFGKGETGEA